MLLLTGLINSTLPRRIGAEKEHTAALATIMPLARHNQAAVGSITAFKFGVHSDSMQVLDRVPTLCCSHACALLRLPHSLLAILCIKIELNKTAAGATQHTHICCGIRRHMMLMTVLMMLVTVSSTSHTACSMRQQLCQPMLSRCAKHAPASELTVTDCVITSA